MSANPIVAGLSIVLVSVLVLGAVLIRPRRLPPPQDPLLDDAKPPPLGRLRAQPRPRPALRAPLKLPACVPVPGCACIAGRVEFPREIPEHPPFEELSLTAEATEAIGGRGEERGRRKRGDEDGDEDEDEDEDGNGGGHEIVEKEIGTDIEEDGRFTLEIEPGDYDLVVTGDASAGDAGAGSEEPEVAFVGAVQRLHAEAGAVIEGVVVVMGRAARIRGQLRGMLGIPVSDALVKIRRANRRTVVAMANPGPDGRFDFGGLRPGRYDVRVKEGWSHRGRTLRGVEAPIDGLVIDLVRLPILTGALGANADGSCPAQALSLVGASGFRATMEIDPDCTFSSEPFPDDGKGVRLEGTIRGVPIALDVAVPASGDPPPLCLGACPSQRARLAIGIAPSRPGDTLDRDGALRVGFETDPGDYSGAVTSGMSMSTPGPVVSYLEGVTVGVPVRVWAERGHARGEAIVAPAPGVNQVVLHLAPR